MIKSNFESQEMLRTLSTKIFFTIALLIIPLSIWAQDEVEDKSDNVNSNRKYKNEIGIDLSPFKFILGESGAGYPSLFYRRHYVKDKAVKSMSGITKTTFHAYRFRVGSNLAFENFDTPDIREIHLSNSYYYRYYDNNTLENTTSFFVRVGSEKQIRSKRFELFYGYDFLVDYSHYEWYYLDIMVGNAGSPEVYNINYEQRVSQKKISFGVAAIGGFKYFLIPRLCFSAEATIDLKYSHTDKHQQYRQFNTANEEYSHEEIPIRKNGISLQINPLFVVNAGYYF